jgi:hypothetical protein
MKMSVYSSMGMLICMLVMSQTAPASEAEGIAYCVDVITQFAASERALIAGSGDNVALREAATESVSQYERHLARLRERLVAIPEMDDQTMAAAAASARADGAAFLSHYEVCWNYCSDQEVGGSPWQACIARCRGVDPVISRLDSCRNDPPGMADRR